MEHLTGGHVTAGYHEVIATKQAIQRARDAKLEGRIPWRVSFAFAHKFGQDADSLVTS